MSDWSEQEKKALIDKLVKETQLGREGEITKTLHDILDVLKKGQIDYKEMANEITKASSKANRGSTSSLNDGSSRPKRNPLLDDDISRSAAVKNLKTSFNSLGQAANTVLSPLKGFAQRLMKSHNGLLNFASSLAVGIKASDVIDDTIKNYRKFSDVGQSFSGSMLQMHIAAADAAMSLDQYTSIMTSTTAAMVNARLGGAYSGMQKDLRKSMMQFGMFGMTTEEVNEQFTEYLSTMQVFGPLSERSQKELVESFQNLVMESTAYAAVTGRSRRAMLKDINESSQNVIAMSRMMLLPAEEAVKAKASMGKVTSLFSAFGDESSKFFGQALGDSMSVAGLAASEFGQELNEAGLSNLIPVFNQLGNSVLSGTATEEEAAATIERFKSSVQNMLPTLHAQATSGNKAAKAVVKMYSEFDSAGSVADVLRRRAEEEKKVKDMQPITKFLSNLGEIISRVSGAFRSGFLTALNSITAKFEKLGDPEIMERITKFAESLGAGFGTLIANLFEDGSAKSMVDLFERISLGLMDFFVILTTKVFPLLGSVTRGLGIAVKFAFDLANMIIDGVEWFITTLFKNFGMSDDKAKEWAKVVAAVSAVLVGGLGLLFGKFLKDKLTNMITNAWNRATGKDSGKVIQAPGAKIFAGGVGGKGGHGGKDSGKIIQAPGAKIFAGGVGGKGGHGGIDLPDLGGGPDNKGGPQSKGARFAKWAKRLGIGAALGGMALGGYGMLSGNETAESAGGLLGRGGAALGALGVVGDLVGNMFGNKGAEGAAAKVGEEAAGKVAAKDAGKLGAKALGKSLLKKIPLIGLGAGGLFAAQRALSGDWTGAGLELASGAASTIPLWGTAASVAIDAGLAARDYGAFDGLGGSSSSTSEPPKLTMAMPPAPAGVEDKKVEAMQQQADVSNSINETLQKQLAVLTDLVRGIDNVNRHLQALPDNMA